MGKIIDITGRKFNKLLVIKKNGSDNRKEVLWLCKCECGNFITVPGYRLRHGDTKSCGCNKREMISKANSKHGHSGDRLYKIWTDMRRRCLNPRRREFKWYGGKGVKITPEWDSFMCFSNWAEESGYKDNLTIDRIDGDGDYSPQNCRWISISEQQRNRKSNVFYKGECLATWAEKLNMPYKTLWGKIHRHGHEVIDSFLEMGGIEGPGDVQIPF